MGESIEYERFERLVKGVLSVPHAVVNKRVEEHREQAAKNPNRPGPKPKVKTSVLGRASRAKG